MQSLQLVLRLTGAWFGATVVAALLAVAASTQFVLASILAMGLEVPLGVRLAATLHDLAGMGPIFGAVIGAGFVIAFPVAYGLRLLTGAPRPFIYALAGGTAIATALLLMTWQFGFVPVAGARTAAQFAVQVLCGALGGLAFAWLSTRLAGAPR